MPRPTPALPVAIRATVLAMVALSLVACQPTTGDDAPPDPIEPVAASTPVGLVEMTVQDFAFVAPPELASGWTTFRLTNTGEQPHFMILWKLPDAVDFEQYAAMAAMFQDGYNPYFAGEATQEEMLGTIVAGLPEWFGDLRAMGGVALISPGLTAETTLLLEPGEYVMECYVLTPEGQFHGTLGMLRPLIVTGESSGAEPPQADVRINLSNYAMEVDGDLSAGPHVIAVTATEQAEGLVRHDVNLARLDGSRSIDEVARWMNWIDALRLPEPATFLGGADHLDRGSTAYFRVDLEPGRYAFVSEGFGAQGMVHEFVVAGSSD